MPANTSVLYEKNAAPEFYEERYVKGYMDEWPTYKKVRVFKLIRQLGLPETGRALDIGCGNGVFTNVIKQALPKWEVYGAEISETAVKHAQKRYPNCSFLVSTDETLAKLKFDFIFSHHVLEHVYNVSEFLAEVNDRLEPQAAMMHICPCGNEGSFDNQISRMVKNGVDPTRENRLFFEEPGHLRRLNTEDVINVVKNFGFKLSAEWYAEHYWSAINYITGWERGEVKKLTNYHEAIDKPAQERLKMLRRNLLLLTYLKLPLNTIHALQKKPGKNVKEWIKLIGATSLFPIAKTVDTVVLSKGLAEWEQKKLDRSGSEMYLYFTRGESSPSSNS